MRTCRPWLKGSLIVMMFAYGIFAVGILVPTLRLASGSRRAQPCERAIYNGWNRAVCRILNVRVHREGQLSTEAQLVVANHISWLDIIVLGAEAPFLFIAKSEVADWPVMGYLAKKIGTLFIKRGDTAHAVQTAERMAWLLRRGQRLLLFPEATTSNGEKVLRFHGKLFHAAQLAGASVQAVAIGYSGEGREQIPFIGDDEFVPHLWAILQLEQVDIHLAFCETLPEGLSSTHLALTTRQQIVEALERTFADATDERQASYLRAS